MLSRYFIVKKHEMWSFSVKLCEQHFHDKTGLCLKRLSVERTLGTPRFFLLFERAPKSIFGVIVWWVWRWWGVLWVGTFTLYGLILKFLTQPNHMRIHNSELEDFNFNEKIDVSCSCFDPLWIVDHYSQIEYSNYKKMHQYGD